MSRLDVKRINRVLSMLYDGMKDLDDDGRDLPIRWNVMHMYSTSQLAKLVALRRGMDVELAALAAALHDIATVITKMTKDHAVKAEPYVKEMVSLYNTKWRGNLPELTKEEEEQLLKAILVHSDKETYSEDALAELMKDVDCLDHYLHGIPCEGTHLERCNRVMKELGIKGY
jgi:uncharacterized protein